MVSVSVWFSQITKVWLMARWSRIICGTGPRGHGVYVIAKN